MRLAVVFLIAALAAAVACAQHVCPVSIEVASSVQSAPSGWETFASEKGEDLPHPLRGVAFADGHPSKRAYLRPTGGDEERDVYDFADVSAEGVWLVCQYRDTRELLFRRIEANYCEVVKGRRPDRPVAEIVCR